MPNRPLPSSTDHPSSSHPSSLLVIGITGGIASGKSTVARMLAAYGFPLFDADAAVHRLLQQDAATIAAITAAFSEASAVPPPIGGLGGGRNKARLQPNTGPLSVSPLQGEKIDRSALAAFITRQPKRLGELEAILHPRVREAELAFIETARADGQRAAILDIPLLFETDAHTLCDKVIVTHAPLEHRKQRAFQRQNMNEAKWQRFLARQLPNHHEHPRADAVIDTGSSEEETRTRISQLLTQWNLIRD